MDALKPLAGAILLAAWAAPSEGEPVLQWQPHIAEASSRFGIPAPWIMQVMRAESAGKTHLNGALIRSRVGAMGLMQLMPATWATMRDRYRLGRDPDDPRDNILAGTAYLRLMYDRFGYPGLFGAYNVGPGRYGAYRSRGVSLPLETRLYMAKVGGEAPAIEPQMPPDGTVRAIYEPAPLSVFAVRPAGLAMLSGSALGGEEKGNIFAIRKVEP